jgi:hypothetical protein
MSMGDMTRQVEHDSEEHQAVVWLQMERTSRGHVMRQTLHREVQNLSLSIWASDMVSTGSSCSTVGLSHSKGGICAANRVKHGTSTF